VDFEIMKFFLLFLMLALCGCCETQKANVALEKRQAAIANEIVSNYTKAILNCKNTNAADFVTTSDSLANRLEVISKELDKSGPLPMDLRKATLEKLADLDKKEVFEQNKMPPILQAQLTNTIIPIMQRYMSAWLSVMPKAGLVTDAKGNLVDVDTNYVEQPSHP